MIVEWLKTSYVSAKVRLRGRNAALDVFANSR